jgi:hypothetical protein
MAFFIILAFLIGCVGIFFLTASITSTGLSFLLFANLIIIACCAGYLSEIVKLLNNNGTKE